MMAFAGNFVSGPDIYWALWSGALVAGIGWGLAETVINPLIASLYPDNKTAKLNAAHAWWPGGSSWAGWWAWECHGSTWDGRPSSRWFCFRRSCA